MIWGTRHILTENIDKILYAQLTTQEIFTTS